MTIERATVVVFLAFAVFLRGGLADAQASRQGDRVVLTSFSGGISKGAYQGGVDYVISEFLRRQRHPAFKQRMGIPGSVSYRLGTATGASAGNINALLASISWCTATLTDTVTKITASNIPAEKSLFWTVWVNTGLTQLLTPYRKRTHAEAAVLDRTFFDSVQNKNVHSFLRVSTPTDCHVPLGITLTRLSPVSVSLVGGQGTASVQRFATVVDVRTVGEGPNKRIEFISPPPKVQSAGSLGALALLNGMDVVGPGTSSSRLDTLYKAVLASSSFPVAFAPMKLCYRHGGLSLASTESDSPCAYFNDGGLFDNNPFGLAMRLHELTSNAADLQMPVDVVYSNPNRFRGRLESARKDTATTAPERQGLSAIMQMLGGALSAATEYELQSLARLIARDDELGLRDVAPGKAAEVKMLLSSRSAPIIGEQLNSFGAFLGRPFREYDFYTGVYDGLEFVARHFICAHQSADRDACTEEAHNALILRNSFELGDSALAVVRWHRAREYRPDSLSSVRRADISRATNRNDAIYSAQWQIRGAIDSAAEHLVKRTDRKQCELRHDPLGSQVCKMGFWNFIHELSRNDEVIQAAVELASWCKSQPRELSAGRCHADDQFVDLLRAPRWYLHDVVERSLENLLEAEDALKGGPEDSDGKIHQQAALVEAAFALYRSSSLRYRTGVEFNPSSARWDTSKLSRFAGSFFLGKLLPNYVVAGLGSSSGVTDLSQVRATSITAGWRPVVGYLGEVVYLTSVAELARFTDDTQLPRSRATSVALGASVGFRALILPKMSSLEVGALSAEHVLSHEYASVTGRDLTVTMATRFAEKLYLGAKWSPDRGTWAVNFGITDVNGLVYWWSR